MTNETPAGEASASSDADTLIEDEAFIIEEAVPQQGVLGFTVRELLIVIVWAVAFVCSFFPAQLLGPGSLWTADLYWLLTIGVPTVAVFLLVLRRFSPDGIRRVGSLGIDQFASVAFTVAAVSWLQTVWSVVAARAIIGDLGVIPWVIWVEFICMILLVVLTVFAPIIPGIREDFRGRIDTLAHRAANPVRPLVARPKHVVIAAEDEAEPGTPTDEDADDDVEAEQVSASAHVSGGSSGTVPLADDDYRPAYVRTSAAQADGVGATDEDGLTAEKA